MPTIATAWQGVAEAESRRAADAALAVYVDTFKEDVPAEESALDAEHQHAMLAAQEAFDETAIGDADVRKANEARWREACQTRCSGGGDAVLGWVGVQRGVKGRNEAGATSLVPRFSVLSLPIWFCIPFTSPPTCTHILPPRLLT